MALVGIEVLVHNFWRQLQNSHKEEELGKTNNSISVSICQMEYLPHSILKLVNILLVALDLSIVVGSECSEEVAVSHHQVTVIILLGGKCLKDLLRWTEKSNLVFIVASDPISGRCLTICSNLLGVLPSQIEIECYEGKHKFKVVSLRLESDTGTQNVVKRPF